MGTADEMNVVQSTSTAGKRFMHRERGRQGTTEEMNLVPTVWQHFRRMRGEKNKNKFYS